MSRRLSLEAYVDGVLAGDRLVLSRAITLCESQRPDDRQLGQQLLQACLPHTGAAYRLGITGAPGVGKSTFIDALGMRLIESGQKVAVLAIDPSSLQSKGSILGDKTRMARLAHHPHAYIRPTPTAGTLGGIANRTKEAMILCDAAGFDWVVVETVGVGQSETAVRHLVDLFLLLLLPNAGDDLQGIKKGIVEMADLLVVNKADGAAKEAARLAQVAYRQALRLFPLPDSGLRPQVLTCSALEESGLADIEQQLLAYRQSTMDNGYWEQRRREQAVHWFDTAVEEKIRDWIFSDLRRKEQYESLRAAVANGQRMPMEAAEAWFEVES